MKKYLKKLGVLSIIFALLAPYIYIPEVQAETTTCEKRLDSYIFLDRSKIYGYKDKNGDIIRSWIIEQSDENDADDTPGYKTYTNVVYNFPANKEIKNIKTTINNFINSDFSANEDDIEGFWDVIRRKASNLSSLDVLEEYGDTYATEYPFVGNGYTNYSANEFDVVTAIFHGPWSNDNFDGEFVENNYYGISNMNKSDIDDYLNRSLQVVFEDYFNRNLTIEFTNAETKSLTRNGKTTYYFEKPSNSSLKTLNAEYFEKLVAGEYEQYTFTDEENDIKYFTAAVTRKIKKTTSDLENDLNEFVFGAKITEGQNSGKFAIYSEDGNYSIKTDLKKEDIKNSYTAMEQGKYFVVDAEEMPSFVDIDRDVPYYWPAVLNVEYEACPQSKPATPPAEDSTSKLWYVDYDSNLNGVNVTNTPSKHSEKLGTNAKVADKKPEAEGYAFQGWCVGSKECTKTVSAGDEITAPTTENETVWLYAQWGKTGTADSEKTGVVSYVIGFAAVGLIAGGIYLASKKKNLFNQI